MFFPKFENSPPKIAPKNFVICWFDEILLILIRGFAWFQVDLAFPQVSPSFLHKIAQISPPKSSNSAPKRVWKSRFRSGIVGPDIRAIGRTSGPLGRTSGSPAGHPAPGGQNRAGFWTSGPGNPGSTPDVRPLGFQPPVFHRFVHN